MKQQTNGLKLFVGHCDFHGLVILLNTSNTIKHIYIILGLMGHCDTTNDLILYTGQCDLYFMVE